MILETVVHAKAHYVRHVAMKCPIDSLISKLFYLITLMIFYIGGKWDELDLMPDFKWVSIWGLVSLYAVQALKKVTMALLG